MFTVLLPLSGSSLLMQDKWRIFFVLLFSILPAFHGTAKGDAVNVISPPIYAEDEAPLTNGEWLAPTRAQQIHSNTMFNSLPSGGATLSAVSFRPDGAVQVGDEVIFGNVKLSLSVTQIAPESMSNTYANNITGTPIVVYDGPWSATAVNEEPIGPATRPFDFRIPLQVPYHYDPATGNLLAEWIWTPIEGITNEGSFDADLLFDTKQQSMEGEPDSDISWGFRFVVVQQFTFIPEPSSLALAITGICLAIKRRC